MSIYELRSRDSLDGGAPSGPFPWQVRDGATLTDALRLASRAHTTDVHADGAYLVTYCGESPYWRLPGGGMHQIGSRGWCHDCHRDGLGYVHHLDYDVELVVLALEAAEDPVLRRQCKADGQTPEQYAAGTAGRAVPLYGDHSFATGVHELGVNADDLAEFAVDMWAMTTLKVAAPVAEGAPDTARKLAEQLAYHAQPRRCYDCNGSRGHSRDCGVTWLAEFRARYPHLCPDPDRVSE